MAGARNAPMPTFYSPFSINWDSPESPQTDPCLAAKEMTALQAQMSGQKTPTEPNEMLSADVAILGETGDSLDRYGTSLAKSGGEVLSHGAVGVGVLLNGVSSVNAIRNNDFATAAYKSVDSAVDVAAAASPEVGGPMWGFLFDMFGGTAKMAKGFAYTAIAQSATGFGMLCGFTGNNQARSK